MAESTGSRGGRGGRSRRSGGARGVFVASVCALILLTVYFATGLFFVQPDERAVVRWFGRVTEASAKLPPGLHYALPWPFCRVDRVRTMEVRRLIIGLPSAGNEMPRASSSGDGQLGDTQGEPESAASGRQTDTRLKPESSGAYDMLSGDVNILAVTMVVQYQVATPADYLVGTAAPDRLVERTVRSVLIEQLAGMPVDQAFTGAKAGLQFDTLRESQVLLDRFGCGIQLVATNLEAIDPPAEVLPAFQDVVSAKKDGERAEDWAATAAARMLGQARGQSASRLSEAQSYAYSRVSRARGESTRFLSVLGAYRKNPELFRRRYELQALERVLPRLRLFVMDRVAGDAQSTVRIIDSAGSR